MRVLGVRCSPTDFAYCVIEGTRNNPSVIHTAEVGFPRAYAKPLVLRWLMQEVDDLVKKHSIDSIALKSSEGLAARGKPFVERTEFETVFMLVGALRGLKPIVKKVKGGIAKDLGFKGKAHYLSMIDTSVIPNFSNLSEKLREAVLVGWSELR